MRAMLKKLLLGLFLLSLIAISFKYIHGQTENPARVLLKQRGVNAQNSSVYAVWAESGEPFAAYQEKMPLIPASTLKIATTYCALKKLGTTHTFKTNFLSEGAMEAGVIKNLWVQGEGDPSLVIEKLWADVQELKNLGLKKIDGDIIVDASTFDTQDYPGRRENNKRAYNAHTSALSLNYNAMPIGRPPHRHYRNIPEADLFFGNNLKALLKESGIIVAGSVKRGHADGKHLLYTAESKPLSEIIRDMNKFSNNFIAEQLVKIMGAEFLGAPGTTAKGMTVIKECLQTIGLNPAHFTIENGSGLSYKNKMSAQDLVKILLAAYHDFKIAPEFISSLSVGGVDGTMRKRKLPNELKGILRAKTGNLDGDSSLAGFLPTQNGTLAFAILMNHFEGGHGDALRAQDNVVFDWLKKNKEKGERK